MNTSLQLRLRNNAHRMTIEATGPLTALTAHLLTKAVVGTLRRYLPPVLELDLTAITDLDFVGDIALRDCAHEAARRGVEFTITTSAAASSSPPPQANDSPIRTQRRLPRPRTLTHAGAICRYRINSR